MCHTAYWVAYLLPIKTMSLYCAMQNYKPHIYPVILGKVTLGHSLLPTFSIPPPKLYNKILYTFSVVFQG